MQLSLFMALLVPGILINCVWRLPSQFTITRSRRIPYPATPIFELVNDLHNWKIWSPWEKLDSEIQYNYSGSQSGEGANMHWVGNKKVGEGVAYIVDSVAPHIICLKLDFKKPIKATYTAEFTFRPEREATHVTWTISGKNSVIGKIFYSIINYDKMVGTQFEKGLASLEEVVSGLK